MRLDGVDAYPVRVKMEEKLVGGAFAYGDYQTVAVRAIVDGVEGWGEAMSRGDPRVNSMLAKHMAKGVVGATFEDAQSLWSRLWRELRVRGHTRGPPMEALSGIEMALEDCQGKIARKGVSAMYSKKPAKEVKAIAGSLFESRGSLEDQVELARGEGLCGAKVKVGFGARKDLDLMKKVRRLWPEGTLVADANGAYDSKAAKKACALFEGLDLSWFEEPVLSDDWQGYAELRGSKTRIGGGESWFASDFERPFEGGLVQVFEPSVSRCGGISVVMRSARMAGRLGIAFCPMVGMNSGLSLAASLHAAAARASEVVEYNPFFNPLQSEMVQGLPKPSGGRVPIPSGFGLGVDVDEKFVRAHSVT